MKTLKKYFANRKKHVFPLSCMLLYILFTGTDLYTTYLATPDLSQEINPVYLYFKWGWAGHLPYALVVLIIAIGLALVSNKYIFRYYESKTQKISKSKFLFVISFLMLAYCYNNLIATFECTINNYLGYIYSYSIHESCFHRVAESYVNLHAVFDNKFGEYSLINFVLIIECLLAMLITILQINRVKKHTQNSTTT
jgi:hypothetical protein